MTTESVMANLIRDTKKRLRLIEAIIGLEDFNEQFGTSFVSWDEFEEIYAKAPEFLRSNRKNTSKE